MDIEDLLRSSLRDHAATVTSRPDEVDVRRRVHRQRRRRQLVPAIGTAAALAAGIVVVGARQEDAPERATATQPADTDQWKVSLPSADLPRLALPGWTTARYQEIGATQPLDHQHQAVVSGDNGRATITTASAPFVAPPTSLPVDIDGATGELRIPADGSVLLTWEVEGGTAAVAGERLSTDDVLRIARGAVIDADLRVVSIDDVPEGMTVELLPVVTTGPTEAEYEFTREEQRLQLHLYSGGQAAFEVRTSGEPRSSLEALGRPASLLDYGTGRYRLDVVIDDRTWEFDGERFDSVDEFLAAVEATGVVDEATWQLSIEHADVSAHVVDASGEVTESVTAPPAAK